VPGRRRAHRGLVDASGQPSDPTILWLDGIRTQDARRVGTKAALLGELRACHIDVPDGFVLTAAAY
jgi:phosphoenolpyruvate synthase/pyruvate phosphate dikinase